MCRTKQGNIHCTNMDGTMKWTFKNDHSSQRMWNVDKFYIYHYSRLRFVFTFDLDLDIDIKLYNVPYSVQCSYRD